MRLYHFTCDHGLAKIRETGELVPQDQPMLEDRLIWFTPFAGASAADLGMVPVMLKCDRMAHRVSVETAFGVAWSEVRGLYRADRVRALEAAPGAKPGYWWVARVPVPVTVAVDRG